jgi:hypothetical protein
MDEPHPVCPPALAEILLEILYRACLSIRIAGWAGQARYCAIEADHVHNLPGLVRNYSVRELQNYWDITRTCYLAEMQAIPDSRVSAYEALWRQLEIWIRENTTERNNGFAR